MITREDRIEFAILRHELAKKLFAKFIDEHLSTRSDFETYRDHLRDVKFIDGEVLIRNGELVKPEDVTFPHMESTPT